MRVLYVALTRAKEKLIITGIEKDYQKEITSKEEEIELYKETDGSKKINKNIIQKYKRYIDWIELVYLKNRKNIENILELKTYKKQEILKKLQNKEEKETRDIQEKLKQLNKEKMNQIKQKLEWEYKHKAPNILTKSSVTKIKQMKLDLTEPKEETKTEYKTPNFLKEEQKSLSGAEIGTLTHLVLQKLDQKQQYNETKMQKLLDELEQKTIINKKQKQAVNIKKILNFTETKIWKEMQNAVEIQKEKPFYINIKAKEIYNTDIEESILVQGIIDLYYIGQDGKITLVDYKTDKVKSEIEIINKYKEQLEIYKKALEHALGKKVNKTYIYSLHLEKEIEI